MKHITDEQFEEEVLESNIPVVVDYWASWCGPCMVLGPMLEEISKNYEGQIKFVKINVSNEAKYATLNKVLSIPSIFFYKDGEIVEFEDKGVKVDRFIGMKSTKDITDLIDKYLVA